MNPINIWEIKVAQKAERGAVKFLHYGTKIGDMEEVSINRCSRGNIRADQDILNRGGNKNR